MFGKIGVIAVLMLMAFAAGWKVQTWRYAAGDTKAAVRTIAVTRAQGQVSTVAAAKDALAQTEVRYLTRTIIKEVPAHVSPETDRRFPLPVGLIRVHDAAALGRELSDVPAPAGRADDQASGVTASDAGKIIAGNYGECRAAAERLTQLQDWLAGEIVASR